MENIKLTTKQEEALRIAKERYSNGSKYVVIAGLAGVGKSTTAKHIVEALGFAPEETAYVAYTGKAADILKKYGNENTSTIHHLIYESYPRPDGTFYHRLVPALPYRCVIIDEISMVPSQLLNQLMSYNAFFICLGDPEQLPPISQNDNNHLLESPHVFLDEIMRQALENEIIRLSMNIREGNYLNPEHYSKDVKIVKKNDLSTGMLTWADQVICATNATKDKYNALIKELKFPGQTLPCVGDKILCTRNYWDIMSNDEFLTPLVNGTVGILGENNKINTKISSRKVPTLDILNCSFDLDSGEHFAELPLDYKMLLTGKPTLPSDVQYRLHKNHPEQIPLEFVYGYAITGWKAQGSQYNKVLVLEEGFPFDREEHRRFLYTCVTRAIDKIVLVRPSI